MTSVEQTRHDVAARPLRIDFLTQWYPPEPARVPEAIVNGLVARGHTVRVVTGTPNYPTGQVAEGYNARRYRTERAGAVSVVHCPLYPSHDASAVKRFLNYGSFALSATPPLLTGDRADVTLVYSSPGTVNHAALLQRAVRGVPTVLLVEDLWPDSALATGLLDRMPAPGALERVLHAGFDATYRAADRVVVTSPGMRDALTGRGVDPARISRMFNWQERSATGQFLRGTRAAGHGLRVVYGGNLGPAQGLDTAIRAVARSAPGTTLTLVGDGAAKQELMALAAEVAPDRIDFLPRVGPEEFESLASTFDASLISLKRDPLFEMTLPGKVPATLALGAPVILSASGDAAALVDEAGAGWSAPAGDVIALVSALEAARLAGPNAREAAGRRGLDYYQTHMTPQAGVQALEGALLAAASPEGER